MTAILPNVVEAIRAHLASAVVGSTVASFNSYEDYRHLDEERDGILGLHIPVPCVIVSADAGGSDNVSARITVTVRHSAESSTLAVHNSDTRLVTDALYAITGLTEATVGRIFSILRETFSAIGFQRQGRAYETSVSFEVVPESED